MGLYTESQIQNISSLESMGRHLTEPTGAIALGGISETPGVGAWGVEESGSQGLGGRHVPPL